jgi:hypothetical protein
LRSPLRIRLSLNGQRLLMPVTKLDKFLIVLRQIKQTLPGISVLQLQMKKELK